MSGLSPIDDLQSGSDREKQSADRRGERHGNNIQPVVLVVDDSDTILCSAAEFLTDIGLSVVTAKDGFEALAKVVDTKPAMLFVDITMPRLDGYQTCALIKNNAEFGAIPAIILSSKDGLFDRARGRVAGADDHLVKPFDAAQITAMVKKYLDATVMSKVTGKSDATTST